MLNEKWYQGQRRLLEAARKDREPNKFYKQFQEAVKDEGHDSFSLEQCFKYFVPDGKQLFEELNPNVGGGVKLNLLEAPGASGAVSTADFSNITGQIVYSAVMEPYQDANLLHPRLARTIPTRFDGEKIPGVSVIGDYSESIGEGDPYPRAKVSEKWIETPQTIKRGVIVDVTKEAIFFDRTQQVLRHASEVGRAIVFNKEKRILDMAFGITNAYKYNGTAYDTYQASTPWINIKASNGLADYTDVENDLLLWDAMTDPHTGEPIMLSGMTMIVPSALYMTARTILNATEYQEVDNQANASTTRRGYPNPLNGLGIDLLSTPYVKARTSSATTWYMGDFQRAFAYMENWPMTVTQAASNSYMEHERDIVSSFKVSERGAAAVMEPRYVIKNTA